MISRCILGNHRWIKAFAELAVVLPQQLVPSPELIGAIGLERAAAQIQLERIGAMPQQRGEQFAVGRGLHQEGGFRFAGELALDRDVAPLPQQRGAINAPEQVGTAAHLGIAERGLVDELHALGYRFTGDGVVGVGLFAGQPGNAVISLFQMGRTSGIDLQ